MNGNLDLQKASEFLADLIELDIMRFELSDWKDSPLRYELELLDKVFPQHGLYERSVASVFELAIAIRGGAVIVKVDPISNQLSFNAAIREVRIGLHHDSWLTPLIVSQLPLTDIICFNIRYGGGIRCDVAIPSEGIYVEVGQTYISNILSGLQTAKEVWVIPWDSSESRKLVIGQPTKVYKFRYGPNATAFLHSLRSEPFKRLRVRHERIMSKYEPPL